MLDSRYNEDEQHAQLVDLIRKKNDQAFGHLIAQMKQWLCFQESWKMFQFKGLTHDQIKLEYFIQYRRNTQFLSRGPEEEAEWDKRHEEHMKACREKSQEAKS